MAIQQIDLSAARAPAAAARARKLRASKAVADYVTATLQSLAKSRDGRVPLTKADIKTLKQEQIDPAHPQVNGNRALIIADHDTSQRSADFDILIKAVSALTGLHRNYQPVGGGMLDTLVLRVLYVDEAGLAANPRLSPLKLESDGTHTHAEYLLEITLFGDIPKRKATVAADLLRQAFHGNDRARLERILNVDMPRLITKRLALGYEVQNQGRKVVTDMVNRLNSGKTDDIEVRVPLSEIDRRASAEADGSNPANDKDQSAIFGTNFAKIVTVVRASVRNYLELQLMAYAFNGKGGKKSAVTFQGFKTFAKRQTGAFPATTKAAKKALASDDLLTQIGPAQTRSVFQPNPRRLMSVLTSPAVRGDGKAISMRGAFGARMEDPHFLGKLYAQVEAVYPLIAYEALRELLNVDGGLSLVSAGYKLPRKAPEVLAKLYTGFLRDAEAKRVLRQVLSGATSPNSGLAAAPKKKGAVGDSPEVVVENLEVLRDKHKEALPVLKAQRRQAARKTQQLLKKIEKTKIDALKQANLERLAKGRQTAAENRAKKKLEKVAKGIVKEETKQAGSIPAGSVLPSPVRTGSGGSGSLPASPASAKKHGAFVTPAVPQSPALAEAIKKQEAKDKAGSPAVHLAVDLTPAMLAKRVLEIGSKFNVDAYGIDKASQFYTGTALTQQLYLAYMASYPATGLTLEKFKAKLLAAHNAGLLKIVPLSVRRLDKMLSSQTAKQRELDSRVIGGGRLIGSTIQVVSLLAGSVGLIAGGIEDAYLELTDGQYGLPVQIGSIMNKFPVEERETVREALLDMNRRDSQLVAITRPEVFAPQVGEPAPELLVTLMHELR